MACLFESATQHCMLEVGLAYPPPQYIARESSSAIVGMVHTAILYVAWFATE